MAFPGDFNRRIALTIDHTQIDTNLTDWTLVFDQAFDSVLTSVDGPLDADGAYPVQSGGGDIRFSSDEAGTTRLAVDVRTVTTANDPATGKLELAVKVPTVSSSTDTTIYLWWGTAATETQPAVGATYGQHDAYDSNYEVVWPVENSSSDRSYIGTTTMVGMQGANGGWGTLFGVSPISEDIDLVVDEDQISDTERAHTTEDVDYWAFETEQPFDILDDTSTIIGEAGRIEPVNTSFQTVNLRNSYTNPVIVASSILPQVSAAPVVTRITNITSTSFDVKIQNPGGINTPSDTKVFFIVIEEGAHTLPGSVAMEAGTVLSTGVNHAADWTTSQMEQITPISSYTSLRLIGQVMSHNDTAWSCFWSGDGASTPNPPTQASCYIGKEVAEDSTIARLDETLGYIIIENGTGTTNGINWIADRVASVEGVDDNPPYSKSTGFSFLPSSGGDRTQNDLYPIVVSSITEVAAAIGNGAELDGTSSYMEPPSPDPGIFHDAFTYRTYEMLLKADDTATRQTLVDEGGGTNGFYIGVYNNELRVVSANDSIQTIVTMPFTDTLAFHHVAGTYDGVANEQYSYLDGSPSSLGTPSYSSVSAHSDDAGVGATNNDDADSNSVTDWGLFFNGVLDEWRMSSVARSLAWLKADYNNQLNTTGFLTWGTIQDVSSGTTTHSLTSTDTVSGTPDVGSPSASIYYNLTSTDTVSGVPSVGSPSSAIYYDFTSTDTVAGAATVGEPSVTVHITTYDLTASNVDAGAPSVGEPSITVIAAGELNSVDVIAGNPTLGEPTFTSTAELTSADLDAGVPLVGVTTLTENIDLSSLDVYAGSPAIENPTITVLVQVLASDVVAGTPTLGTPLVVPIGQEMLAEDVVSGEPSVPIVTLSYVPEGLLAELNKNTIIVYQVTAKYLGWWKLEEIVFRAPTATGDRARFLDANGKLITEITGNEPGADVSLRLNGKWVNGIECKYLDSGTAEIHYV